MSIPVDIAILRDFCADSPLARLAVDRVEAEIARLHEGLRQIADQQTKTLSWLRANGIVFDGPLGTDPKDWQNVSFSIYTDLCEVDTWAHQLLDEDLAGRSLLADAGAGKGA